MREPGLPVGPVGDRWTMREPGLPVGPVISEDPSRGLGLPFGGFGYAAQADVPRLSASALASHQQSVISRDLQWDDSLTMASYAPLEVRAMAKSAREYRQRMRELEAREQGRQEFVAGPDLDLKVLREQRHEASRIRLLRVAEHAAEEAAQVFFQRTSELQPSVVVPSSGDAVLSAATSEPQPLVEPSEPPRAGYVWTRSSSFGSGIQWIEIPMSADV